MAKWKPSNLLLAEIAIASAPVIFYVLAYPYLPEIVITHYGVHGADGFHHKDSITVICSVAMGFFGVVFAQGMALLVKKFPQSIHGDTDLQDAMMIIKGVGMFLTVLLSLLAFFVMEFTPLMHAHLSAAATIRMVCTLSGILEIVIGNLLPRVPQNPLVGVRLSATMQSKAIWYKAQRFAGRVLIVCGLVQLVIGLLLFIPNTAAVLIQQLLYPVMIVCIIVYTVTRKKPGNE
ncbi:MAG: SdpI family protein [Ethanoligenens sp.]|uniref:SdpI family protein n=1 Tax=Ethanoligenens sp. TaxID=2099655 RepID=UPI0039EC1B04